MVFYSDFQQSYIWLPIIGFVIGLLATTIGSGGGFFFPLVLILFFHIPAQIAVATSLTASLPLLLTGTWGHYRKNNIHKSIGLLFGLAGVAGAVAGAWTTQLIQPGLLQTAFGTYAIILAVVIFINSLKDKAHTSSQNVSPTNLSPAMKTMGVGYGFVGGAISGTFGTSGAMPVLAGLLAMRIPFKLVVGTSLAVVFINTVSAMAGHFILGEVDLTLVFLLTTGSVIGALIGPGLLDGAKTGKFETPAKRVLAIFIVISGILLIIK